MARTVRTKVYKFNELSKEAQAKVIEKMYDINVDYDWWKWTIEEQTEDLTEKGYEDVEISFSGFGSQGDGASLTGKLNLLKWLENNGNALKIRSSVIGLINSGKVHVGIDITRFSHHYVHERSTSVNVSVDFYSNGLISWPDNIEKYLLDKLENYLESEVIRLNKGIYKALEEEYFYQTSEEAIKETIEANEYEFTQDGRLFS